MKEVRDGKEGVRSTTASALPSSRTPHSSIEVAAGLIFRDGKLLISQRPHDSHLGGLWEFPGGKREATETFQQCLRRELKEELGIEVEVGELFDQITHTYPERTVHLKFYCCRWIACEPQAIACAAVAWAAFDELAQYVFPAADARLLTRLTGELSLWE